MNRAVQDFTNYLAVVRAGREDDVGGTGFTQTEKLAAVRFAPNDQWCKRITLRKSEDAQSAVLAAFRMEVCYDCRYWTATDQFVEVSPGFRPEYLVWRCSHFQGLAVCLIRQQRRNEGHVTLWECEERVWLRLPCPLCDCKQKMSYFALLRRIHNALFQPAITSGEHILRDSVSEN